MNRRFHRHRAAVIPAVLVCLAVFASEAVAQTWNGTNPGDPNWGTGANWVGGTPPATSGSVTFANSAATVTATNNNLTDSGQTFLTLSSLTVSATAPSSAWSVSGNPLVVPNISVPSGMTLTLSGGLGTAGNAPLLNLGGTGGTLILTGPSFINGAFDNSTESLLVNTTLTSTGAIQLGSGGTLGGSGTITGGSVNVLNSSTLTPGSGPGAVGTLTAPATTFGNPSTFAVDLGAGGASDLLLLNAGASLSLPSSGLTLAVGGFRDSQTRSYTIATVSGGGDILLGGSSASGTLGTAVVGGSTTGPVTINPTGFASGDSFTLVRSGNNLVLNFVPAPEPVAVMGVYAVALLGGRALWRRRRAQSASSLN
jgi:hypothetical protein